MQKYEILDEKEEREERELKKQLEKAHKEKSKKEQQEKEKTQSEDALAYRMGVEIKQRTVFRQWSTSETAKQFLTAFAAIAAGSFSGIALFFFLKATLGA